jgi:hypothetical protein
MYIEFTMSGKAEQDIIGDSKFRKLGETVEALIDQDGCAVVRWHESDHI